MDVVLLHAGPAYCERALRAAFARRGHRARLVHIATVDQRRLGEIARADLVMNRVYASTAARRFDWLRRAIDVSAELAERGAPLCNSHSATLAEYSKLAAYERLVAAEVPTPATALVTSVDDVDVALAVTGLPAVIKRDTTGRGRDLSLVDSREEAVVEVRRRFASGRPYYRQGGHLVLQRLVVATVDHDVRLGLLDYQPFVCYGRSYVPGRGGGRPWIGSVAQGSAEVPHDAGPQELQVAWQATAAVGARLNEVDLCLTAGGPVVIENNPIPAYGPGGEGIIDGLVAALVEPSEALM